LSPQFTEPVTWKAWLAYLTMTFNITGPAGLFNNALWSLPIEMQFYLFFPLCIIAFASQPPKKAILIITLVAAAAYGFSALFHVPGATLARLWEFLAGAMIGLYCSRIVAVFEKQSRFVVLICFILLAFLNSRFQWLPRIRRFPPNFWDLVFCFPLAVAGLAYEKHLVVNYLVSKLVRLGEISYSVYLLHMVVLGILAPTLSWMHLSPWVFGIILFILAFTITWWLSELSYRFLEQPFMRLGKRFTRRDFLPVALSKARASLQR
jgi:peptidoglycan/LPS O-acetylase OafA/YrhL